MLLPGLRRQPCEAHNHVGEIKETTMAVARQARRIMRHLCGSARRRQPMHSGMLPAPAAKMSPMACRKRRAQGGIRSSGPPGGRGSSQPA
jgi:hypothetical protein